MKKLTSLITLGVGLLLPNCNSEKNTKEDYTFGKSKYEVFSPPVSDSINLFYGDSMWNSLNSKEERIKYIKEGLKK